MFVYVTYRRMLRMGMVMSMTWLSLFLGLLPAQAQSTGGRPNSLRRLCRWPGEPFRPWCTSR
jgi:hypothetical protein